ncbi:MAG TPA: monovalent cation/H+ antiporter complex subunit F [Alkalispirochaeta sp.]|nr:monovalent cation/H+ antiporter complex subunit F [Alkalispirochaeta sp.]
MEQILTYAIWFFVGSAAVSMVRVVIGPSSADRMTGLNMVSSQVLAVLVLVAVREGRSSYLDVALVYDIFGFIGILAMARYFGGSRT